MIKQLLLDELDRLQNTNEVMDEKQLFVESIQKLIRELTANTQQLGREFEIRQILAEVAAKKSEEGANEMIYYVASGLFGVASFGTT